MRLRASVAAVLLVALQAGCHGGGAPQNRWVDLTPARDQSPDPRVVEVSIEARDATKTYLPGKTTRVLAYNGTVPGPLIEAIEY